MDPSVVQRLMRVEEDLLDAIISDGAALEQCAQDWPQLCIDIKAAALSHQLQDTTLQLAHEVGSRVIILSRSIYRASMTCHKDMNELFAAMSLSEQPTDIPCTSVSRAASTLPLYVKPAYTWLMENLHNPYPPKHVKAKLSRESGCNVKDIDNWFINVRRRIDWNRVRRVHFANKRQEILSAAARFFGKTDGSQSLDSHLEMEFASIQNLAETLYNDKFVDVQYPSRSESPKESSDSGVEGSVDNVARPAIYDAKHTREERPEDPIKQVPLPLSAGPRTARTTKRHCDDQEDDSRKAAKKRKIDATEDVNQISSFPRTIADDTPEGSIIPNEPTNSRKRRRSLSPGESESCTRQRSAMESSSRNTTVPDPLPFDTLLSGLWPFDNAAFCSAFSAEQTSHPDLSLPLEIELFDPSQLFVDFDAMTATQGVQDHTALHLNPSLHIPSISNLTGVQDYTALHPNPSLHMPPISNLIGVQDPTALHSNPSLHMPPVSNLAGVQDPTALHPNPLLDIPSISNDPELTSHDEQSSSSSSQGSPLSEPGLLNTVDPAATPVQDSDWLLNFLDDKAFNKACGWDMRAFGLPFDFGLTAPC